MLNTVTRGNAVIDTQANDPNGMPRPSEISAAPSGGAKLWSTGVNNPYAYDGAGNVTRMGGSRFLYDLVSRLKAGTVPLGVLGESGGTKTQVLTYDSFGNIQSIGGHNFQPTLEAPGLLRRPIPERLAEITPAFRRGLPPPPP